MRWVTPETLSRLEGMGIIATRLAGRCLGKNGVSLKSSVGRPAWPEQGCLGGCAGEQLPGFCPGKACGLGPEHSLYSVGFQGWVRSHDGPHWEDLACPSSQPRPALEGWKLWAGNLW